MKAIFAAARRIAEGLWWVMVRNEPYKLWNGEPTMVGNDAMRTSDKLVDSTTGEVLNME
jgi:hypothetical protein